jgi:hypothetical protein
VVDACVDSELHREFGVQRQQPDSARPWRSPAARKAVLRPGRRAHAHVRREAVGERRRRWGSGKPATAPSATRRRRAGSTGTGT